MQRDKILTDLFNSKEFNNCIRKMEPASLQEELKAEVCLVMCEIDAAKLIGLHERGELKYYAARVVINMIKSGTSEFYKKFREAAHRQRFLFSNITNGSQDTIRGAENAYSVQTELASEDDYRYNKYIEEIKAVLSYEDTDTPEWLERENEFLAREQAIAEIDNLYWYDSGIVKLYIKHGNYRAIEKETGIPWESAYKTVQKACREIKQKISA